jgi:hypothetical protein
MAASSTLPAVHVLFENPAWLPPLIDGLEAEGFTVHLHELDEGLIDPTEPPADGIWINRISPSSHTRSHHGSVALAREVLYWLEAHGRRVINGTDAFEFEMSKLRQDIVLRKYGIRTPRTLLGFGRDGLIEGAKSFDGPFITKHNQGGKGLGIRLMQSVADLERWLDSDEFDSGPDGKILLQEYIQSPNAFITRVEVVGDRFLFAMRSATTDGFELCPSDACQVPAIAPDVCPADSSAADSKFSGSPLTADDPLVRKYLALLAGEGIDVAGIEFVEDAEGRRYTYDINGTTNYSGVLGEKIGVDGMHQVAGWIKRVVVPSLTTLRVAS